MPNTQLQLRRGNTAQTAIFTGAVAEVTIDTDKKTLIVHDGSTAGGIELAKQSHANSAYNVANTVTLHAHSAYDQANDATTHAQTAGAYANSAYVKANSAFNTANTISLHAHSAYDQANDATTHAQTAGAYANGAYSKANTADQRAVTSGSYANSAYTQANTATINASTADQKAVSAGSYANSAYAKANTAITSLAGYATESYVGTAISNLVDSAPSTLDTLNELAAALGDDPNFATSISNMVGVSGGYANSAFSKANTATTNAATADQKAVSAGSYANSAYAQANTSSANALSAGSYANSAYAQANTGTILAQAAYDQANTGSSDSWARTTANSASSYANSAFAKANTSIIYDTELLESNTANQVIDTFSTTDYRTAKYVIQAINGSDIHATELLVTHNDTIAYHTEYATLTSANSLFDIYTNITSSNVVIQVSPTNAGNTQFDFSRISIVARTLSSLEGDFMTLSGSEDLMSGSGTVDLN